MNRLNDKKYKASLKSVKDPFDKMALWDEIDQKLAEKERRPFPFWWLAGIGMFVLLSLVGLMYFAGQKEISTKTYVQSEASNTISPSFEKEQRNMEKDIVTNEKLENEKANFISNKTAKGTKLASAVQSLSQSKSENTIALQLVGKKENQTENNAMPPMLTPANPIEEARTMSSLPSSKTTQLEHNLVAENRNAIAIPNTLDGMKYSMIPSPLFLLVTPEEDPLITRPFKNPRLTFGIEINGGTNDRQIKSLNSESKSYVASRQAKEKGLYRTGLNVELAYKFKPNWALTTSLQWQRLVERFNAEEIDITTTQIASDSATYAVDGGVVTYFPGMINRSRISTRQVQHYNHTHKVSVSFGLRYETKIGPVPLYAQGRVLYHPSFRTDGKMINSNEEIVAYTSNAELGIGRESRFETQLGLGMSWPLSKGIKLTTGIQWQQDFFLKNQNTDVRILDSGLGLAIGIRGFVF